MPPLDRQRRNCPIYQGQISGIAKIVLSDARDSEGPARIGFPFGHFRALQILRLGKTDGDFHDNILFHFGFIYGDREGDLLDQPSLFGRPTLTGGPAEQMTLLAVLGILQQR